MTVDRKRFCWHI